MTHLDWRRTVPQGPDTNETSLGYSGALVLQAVTLGHRYGFQIMRAAHLPSGTVYPLLRRMEAHGLVASRWEDAEEAREEGRPARHYYRATPEGLAALAEARERLAAQRRLFGADVAEEGGSA